MLDRLQRDLQAIYRLDIPHRVEDFMVDRETFVRLRPDATAPEEVLVLEDDDEVQLAVYIDGRVLESLDAHDPDDPEGAVLDGDLGAYATALEGVSHFVYLADRAARGRRASLLELETQAEVDKFVTALLYLWRRGHKQRSPELRRRLFHAVRYRDDLDQAEDERYRTANDLAGGYCRRLEARYLGDGSPEGLLRELRAFYRLGVGEKMSHLRVH